MKCPQCGTLSPFSTGTFCSHCGALLHAKTENSGSTPLEEAFILEPDVPWESSLRTRVPLKALYTTFIEVIFHPDRFYRAAAASKSQLFPALWYGLICGSIGIIGSWLWSEVLIKYGQSLDSFSALFGSLNISSSSLIMTPFMLLCQFFILALYTRFIMHFSGGKKPPLSGIIRILCYAESTSLLLYIPAFGYGIAIVAGVYSILTGYHHLFGVSRKKIFFILILPLFIIIGCIMLIIVAGIIGGTIVGAGFLQQWLSPIR